MGRHGREIWKTSVVHLLLTAGRIEFDDLDQVQIEEIRNGRIVERNVPILADAKTNEIDRTLGQQRGVAPDPAQDRQLAHEVPDAAAVDRVRDDPDPLHDR